MLSAGKMRKNAFTDEEPQLRGWLLLVAKGVWIVLLGLVLFFLLMTLLRPFLGGKIYVCPLNFTCSENGLPYTEQTRRVLEHAHISLAAYDTYVTIFGIIYVCVFLAMSTLLFWRKFTHPVGMLAAIAFLLIAASTLESGAESTLQSNLLILIASLVIENCQALCLGFFLVIFPDGRFVPRWSWLIGCTLFVQALFFELPGPLNILSWPFPLIAIELILAYGSPIALQVYRYTRVYTPSQRKQTQWVLFGLVCALFFLFMGFFSGSLFPDLSFYQLTSDSFASIGFLFIPLSVSVAILRSGLWDIDVIINRTLVYGLLTLILVLIYTGLVIGAQSLLVNFIGKNDDIIVVGSTLVVATLFQPLRVMIQKLIDRRFYRQKYDMARTLSTFSATLQQEVDLERLSERIVQVVQGTLHPAHISLWLCNWDNDNHSLKAGEEEAK